MVLDLFFAIKPVIVGLSYYLVEVFRSFNNDFNRLQPNQQLKDEAYLARMAFSKGYDRGKEEGRKFLQEKLRKEKQVQN